ncbi:hypothetical protein F1728_06465 [Gimesia benthica]|uniref:Type I restriction endonuclease subunit M n=1 Tax=Gimesia benthica TaxID=2608982 RepID=A0A6I6A8B1_9PLAN|nr:hypothetical protein [Gimesia benthica]QGQ22336.1 hypothetical protein F1728_06465 [Gimesia benthica]
MIQKSKPLFQLGRTVSTHGALDALQKNNQSPLEFFKRHQHGDWSVLCEEDRQTNEQALKDGDRIFSVYHLNDDTKIWVITEADRSATTIFLPEEY